LFPYTIGGKNSKFNFCDCLAIRKFLEIEKFHNNFKNYNELGFIHIKSFDFMTIKTFDMNNYNKLVFIHFKSFASCFSNLLWIKSIESPNKIAETIKTVFTIPLTEKEILINMVEMINPEFRITL